jgi:hypothetical protein
MPKNIIIFFDGTGHAGGINFDEIRTNVYKLYRACRVGRTQLSTPVNRSRSVIRVWGLQPMAPTSRSNGLERSIISRAWRLVLVLRQISSIVTLP